jgi:molybdopterin synthase catalytic subunit
MIKITADPIDPSEAYALLSKKSSGSIVLHYAVVKEDNLPDRPTLHIVYQVDGDMELELAGIAAELKSGWSLEDVLLVRRTGCLSVGDIISLVAVSSPNSSDAFEACRHGISRLKKMATVRKQEMHL